MPNTAEQFRPQTDDLVLETKPSTPEDPPAVDRLAEARRLNEERRQARMAETRQAEIETATKKDRIIAEQGIESVHDAIGHHPERAAGNQPDVLATQVNVPVAEAPKTRAKVEDAASPERTENEIKADTIKKLTHLIEAMKESVADGDRAYGITVFDARFIGDRIGDNRTDHELAQVALQYTKDPDLRPYLGLWIGQLEQALRRISPAKEKKKGFAKIADSISKFFKRK